MESSSLVQQSMSINTVWDSLTTKLLPICQLVEQFKWQVHCLLPFKPKAGNRSGASITFITNITEGKSTWLAVSLLMEVFWLTSQLNIWTTKIWDRCTFLIRPRRRKQSCSGSASEGCKPRVKISGANWRIRFLKSKDSTGLKIGKKIYSPIFLL